jgi:Iap family predicted aminopeptidase
VAQQRGFKVSTPEAIKTEFNSVPCKNEERMAAVKALFERVGATESDETVEKYKSVENFVIRKPGASPETIIIGAHYDKVSDGCGAIDNWTGIVAVAHVFSAVREVPLQKTVLFVAFGNEEKGLMGSQAMVGAIDKNQRAQYCAMINIDSLGLAVPQALDNVSSKKLTQLAADLAEEMKMQFSHASVGVADADSSPFVAKKIPAVTIHGLSNDWQSILHTRNDQVSKINPLSVYLGYRLALALLIRIDSSACTAYR